MEDTMRDEATFSQVKKLFEMLGGLDAEQANRVLARIGAVAGEVRAEGPQPHYSYRSPGAVAEAWKVVQKTVPHEQIVFTIAHQIYGDHIRECKHRFQLRCWRGVHGQFSVGRCSDKGENDPTLLFETLIERPPHWKCNCCWQNELREVGIVIRNADNRSRREMGDTPHWRRTKITGVIFRDRYSFDILRYDPLVMP